MDVERYNQKKNRSFTKILHHKTNEVEDLGEDIKLDDYLSVEEFIHKLRPDSRAANLN